MPSESQLALWLNTEVYPPLPRPVGSIDHDFSNGYLLGHLCARLAPQLAFPTPLDSSFTTALHDADTPSAKLANFGQVMGLLNSVGVRLSMEDVDAVATEQRGAATALLLRIKDVLDQKQRRATTASAAGGSSKTGTGSMSPSSPLRGDAPSRLGESFREKQSRKLEGMTFAERLVASGMGTKQVAMELHLEDFEMRRVHREKEIAAEDEATNAARMHSQMESIRRIRDKRHKDLEGVPEAEAARHAAQMQRMQDIERRSLAAELTASEISRIQRHNARVSAKQDAQTGISSFEASMRRLGIDTSATASHTAGVPGGHATSSPAGLDGSGAPGRKGMAVAGRLALGTVVQPTPRQPPVDEIFARVLPGRVPLSKASTSRGDVPRGLGSSLSGTTPALSLSAVLGDGSGARTRIASSAQPGLNDLAAADDTLIPLYDTLEHTLTHTYPLHEADKYAAALKTRVAENRELRRERQTRQNLMNNLQVAAERSMAVKVAQSSAISRFLETAAAERDAGSRALKEAERKEMEHVAIMNRVVAEDARRDAALAAIMDRDRTVFEEDRRIERARGAKARETHEEGARAYAQVKAARHAADVLSILHLLVDTVHEACTRREALAWVRKEFFMPLPPQEWRALKQRFVSGSVKGYAASLVAAGDEMGVLGSGSFGASASVGGGGSVYRAFVHEPGAQSVCGSLALGGGALPDELMSLGYVPSAAAAAVVAPSQASTLCGQPLAGHRSLPDLDDDVAESLLDWADAEDLRAGRGAWELPSATTVAQDAVIAQARTAVSCALDNAGQAAAQDSGTTSVGARGVHTAPELAGALSSELEALSALATPLLLTTGDMVASLSRLQQRCAHMKLPTHAELHATDAVAVCRTVTAVPLAATPVKAFASRPLVCMLLQERRVDSPLAFSSMQCAVVTRLARRMHLIHVEAVDILLLSVRVFEHVNARLGAMAEECIAAGQLTVPFPQPALSSIPSVASALATQDAARDVKLSLQDLGLPPPDAPGAWTSADAPLPALYTLALHLLSRYVQLLRAVIAPPPYVAPAGAPPLAKGALPPVMVLASKLGGDVAVPEPVRSKQCISITAPAAVSGVPAVPGTDVGAVDNSVVTSMEAARDAVLSVFARLNASAGASEVVSAPGVKTAQAKATGAGPVPMPQAAAAPATAPALVGKTGAGAAAPAPGIKGKALTEQPPPAAAKLVVPSSLLELPTPAESESAAVSIFQALTYSRPYVFALAACVGAANRTALAADASAPASGGIVLDGIPLSGAVCVALEHALHSPILWAAPGGTSSVAPADAAASSSAVSALPSTAPMGSEGSRAASPYTPHAPADWDGSLRALLDAYDSGAWALPAVGEPAQREWCALNSACLAANAPPAEPLSSSVALEASMQPADASRAGAGSRSSGLPSAAVPALSSASSTPATGSGAASSRKAGGGASAAGVAAVGGSKGGASPAVLPTPQPPPSPPKHGAIHVVISLREQAPASDNAAFAVDAQLAGTGSPTEDAGGGESSSQLIAVDDAPASDRQAAVEQLGEGERRVPPSLSLDLPLSSTSATAAQGSARGATARAVYIDALTGQPRMSARPTPYAHLFVEAAVDMAAVKAGAKSAAAKDGPPPAGGKKGKEGAGTNVSAEDVAAASNAVSVVNEHGGASLLLDVPAVNSTRLDGARAPRAEEWLQASAEWGILEAPCNLAAPSALSLIRTVSALELWLEGLVLCNKRRTLSQMPFAFRSPGGSPTSVQVNAVTPVVDPTTSDDLMFSVTGIEEEVEPSTRSDAEGVPKQHEGASVEVVWAECVLQASMRGTAVQLTGLSQLLRDLKANELGGQLLAYKACRTLRMLSAFVRCRCRRIARGMLRVLRSEAEPELCTRTPVQPMLTPAALTDLLSPSASRVSAPAAAAAAAGAAAARSTSPRSSGSAAGSFSTRIAAAGSLGASMFSCTPSGGGGGSFAVGGGAAVGSSDASAVGATAAATATADRNLFLTEHGLTSSLLMSLYHQLRQFTSRGETLPSNMLAAYEHTVDDAGAQVWQHAERVRDYCIGLLADIEGDEFLACVQAWLVATTQSAASAHTLAAVDELAAAMSLDVLSRRAIAADCTLLADAVTFKPRTLSVCVPSFGTQVQNMLQVNVAGRPAAEALAAATAPELWDAAVTPGAAVPLSALHRSFMSLVPLIASSPAPFVVHGLALVKRAVRTVASASTVRASVYQDWVASIAATLDHCRHCLRGWLIGRDSSIFATTGRIKRQLSTFASATGKEVHLAGLVKKPSVPASSETSASRGGLTRTTARPGRALRSPRGDGSETVNVVGLEPHEWTVPVTDWLSDAHGWTAPVEALPLLWTCTASEATHFIGLSTDAGEALSSRGGASGGAAAHALTRIASAVTGVGPTALVQPTVGTCDTHILVDAPNAYELMYHAPERPLPEVALRGASVRSLCAALIDATAPLAARSRTGSVSAGISAGGVVDDSASVSVLRNAMTRAGTNIPAAWACAPTASLRAWTRAITPTPPPPGSTWNLAATRAFALSALLLRLRMPPTVEQILVMRANFVANDADADGIVQRAEFNNALLVFEIVPARAATVLHKLGANAAAVGSRKAGGRRSSAVAVSATGLLTADAIAQQGGDRDPDAALQANLVAPSLTSRASDAVALRDALWTLFADTAAGGLAYDALCFAMCADPRSPVTALHHHLSTSFASLDDSKTHVPTALPRRGTTEAHTTIGTDAALVCVAGARLSVATPSWNAAASAAAVGAVGMNSGVPGNGVAPSSMSGGSTGSSSAATVSPRRRLSMTTSGANAVSTSRHLRRAGLLKACVLAEVFAQPLPRAALSPADIRASELVTQLHADLRQVNISPASLQVLLHHLHCDDAETRAAIEERIGASLSVVQPLLPLTSMFDVQDSPLGNILSPSAFLHVSPILPLPTQMLGNQPAAAH